MTIDLNKVAPLSGLLRKPHVNSTCIGCGACTAISGDVFELDENGLSHVKPCDTYEGKDVDDAIAACPVNAISWQEVDADGNYKNGLKEHEDA